MVYVVYSKSKKGKERWGLWDFRTYKTRVGALNRVKFLSKKYGKKGKYVPAFKFEVRKRR